MSDFPTQLFINGDFVRGHGAKRISQIDPATEEVFAEVEAASVNDVDVAVNGAQRAFESTWRDMTPGKRAEVLFQIAHAIRRDAEHIAQIESRNIGKPISDARDEVDLGARIFEYYA